MTRNAKKKRPAPRKGRASNANTEKSTGCRCAAQLHFEGFPPPPLPGEGPLAAWLEAHPGWWGRQFLCATLGMDDRSIRLQAEHSGGRVIFNSGMGGLSATAHAMKIEMQNCAAELRNRAASHLRRAAETETAWIGLGGTL